MEVAGQGGVGMRVSIHTSTYICTCRCFTLLCSNVQVHSCIMYSRIAIYFRTDGTSAKNNLYVALKSQIHRSCDYAKIQTVRCPERVGVVSFLLALKHNAMYSIRDLALVMIVAMPMVLLLMCVNYIS